MSRRNVEIVRHGYEAMGRGDARPVLAALADEVTWDGVEGVDPCRDREEVEYSIRRNLERGFPFVIDELVDGGDRVVVCVRATPEHFELGDVPEPYLGQQLIFNVVTLRDGKVVHIQDYISRERALAAAGIARQSESA